MRVLFDCSTGGPNYEWSDPSVLDGIGGSEECVILLARELAKLGHMVTVYNNCQQWAGIWNGVEYRHHDQPRVEVDVYVAWRNWHLLKNVDAKYKWLWCHDIPLGVHCPTKDEMPGAIEHIDKFVLLNNYHSGIYQNAGVPENNIFVAPIGVDWDEYNWAMEVLGDIRDRARVLYFSHPGRGLDRLREVWPLVKAAVPEATLASFWWEPEHFRPANEQLGILPMHKLGYKDIIVETLKAGIFGYPCVFAPEISPATTIKAQFGGAIPVVVMQGGMVDTVKFGMKCSQDQFTQVLISALKMSIGGTFEYERAQMMRWARETYSWSSVAALWSSQWTEGEPT
jgi:glycosyltransferase involved in cell wall biosynthesis